MNLVAEISKRYLRLLKEIMETFNTLNHIAWSSWPHPIQIFICEASIIEIYEQY
jgi:hypothetical protein